MGFVNAEHRPSPYEKYACTIMYIHNIHVGTGSKGLMVVGDGQHNISGSWTSCTSKVAKQGTYIVLIIIHAHVTCTYVHYECGCNTQG